MLAEIQRLARKLEEFGIIDETDFAGSDPAFLDENTRAPLVLARVDKNGKVTRAEIATAYNGQKNWAAWGKTTFPRINIAKNAEGRPDFEKARQKLADAAKNLTGGRADDPAGPRNWPLVKLLERAAQLQDPEGLIEKALAEKAEELAKNVSWKDWFNPKKAKSAKGRVLLVPDENPLGILRMISDTLAAYKARKNRAGAENGGDAENHSGGVPKIKAGQMPVQLISVNKTSLYLKHWGTKPGQSAPFPAIAAARRDAAKLQAALNVLASSSHADGPNPITQRCCNGNVLVLASRESAIAHKITNKDAEPILLGFVLQPKQGSARITKIQEMTLEEASAAYRQFAIDCTPPARLDVPWADKKEDGNTYPRKEGESDSQLHYRQINRGLQACMAPWTFKGQQPPEQNKGKKVLPLPVNEDAVIQTPDPKTAAAALRQALLRTHRLLEPSRTRIFHKLAANNGKAKPQTKAKTKEAGTPPWLKTIYNQNLVLQTLCWFHALATRPQNGPSDQNQKLAMKTQPAMILGATLAAADKAHAAWSKARNNGKIPGTLAGEACFKLACADPRRAVAELATRCKPFLDQTLRWQNKENKPQNPESIRACQTASLLRQLLAKLAASLAQNQFDKDPTQNKFALTLGYHSNPWEWFERRAAGNDAPNAPNAPYPEPYPEAQTQPEPAEAA